MYNPDQGAAFAAQALTGLHAGVGLPAVDPRASPAGEAAGDGDFVPGTEGNGDQETQGATQGTAPAAQAGSPAAEHPEAGEETAQDEDQDKCGEDNLGLGGGGVTTDRDKAAAMSIMPGCQHHNLTTWPKGPGCLPCPKTPPLSEK